MVTRRTWSIFYFEFTKMQYTEPKLWFHL